MGTTGAGVSANGSAMGVPGDCQAPVLPGKKLGGATAGAPNTPNRLPVKLGPAWLRSITPFPTQEPAPVAAAHVWLPELTWMLLKGPPITLIVELPLT